jgi:hypothetical protein
VTPAQRAVYDNYPYLCNVLTQAAGAVAGLPLDDMKAVADQVRLTGVFVGAPRRGGPPPDVAVLARLAGLIDAAIVFRDTAVTGAVGGGTPP